MTRHVGRYVLTWCAFVGCLIGFLITGLPNGGPRHPFAPLMFLLGAFVIFGLGLLDHARSDRGHR